MENSFILVVPELGPLALILALVGALMFIVGALVLALRERKDLLGLHLGICLFVLGAVAMVVAIAISAMAR